MPVPPGPPSFHLKENPVYLLKKQSPFSTIHHILDLANFVVLNYVPLSVPCKLQA